MPKPPMEPLESRRLLTAGQPDSHFGGGDGLAVVEFGGFREKVTQLAALPDGRILLVGAAQRRHHTPTSDYEPADEAFARLLPDGSLDPSFGPHGRGMFVTRP